MAVREQLGELGFFNVINAHRFDSGDITGSDIDTQGYNAVTFVCNTGEMSCVGSVASTTSYWVVRLQHASASTAGGAGTYSDCLSADMVRDWSGAVTSGIVLSLCICGSYTAQDSLESRSFGFGYIGKRRYVRCIIESKAALSTADMSISAILGEPANWPINDVVGDV